MPSADTDPYRVRITKGAARQLSHRLPEAVATAVLNFITGDLLVASAGVGKPLQRELAGMHVARRGDSRVIYRSDDRERTVTVADIEHRRDIYRPR